MLGWVFNFFLQIKRYSTFLLSFLWKKLWGTFFLKYELGALTTNFNSLILSKSIIPKNCMRQYTLLILNNFQGGVHQNWGSAWKHFGGAHLPTPQAWKFSRNDSLPKPKKTVMIGRFRQWASIWCKVCQNQSNCSKTQYFTKFIFFYVKWTIFESHF